MRISIAALAVLLGLASSVAAGLLALWLADTRGFVPRDFALVDSSGVVSVIGQTADGPMVSVCLAESAGHRSTAALQVWIDSVAPAPAAPRWCEPRLSKLAQPRMGVLPGDVGIAVGWPIPFATAWFDYPTSDQVHVLWAPGESPPIRFDATAFPGGSILAARFFRDLQPRIEPIGLACGGLVHSVAWMPVLLLAARAAQAVRRHWRLRLGLCPACRHPRGPSANCTECGAGLVTTSERSA